MSFVKSVFDVDMDTFNTRAPLDESLGPTNPLVRAGMSNMRISLSGGLIPKTQAGSLEKGDCGLEVQESYVCGK